VTGNARHFQVTAGRGSVMQQHDLKFITPVRQKKERPF
jgi:hypothetical protein